MSQQENSQINQQNNQPNQELKQLPQQQVYPMQNQPQQNNSSQIIAQQINFDQQNLQQPQQIYQQPYQQHQFQYLQPQQFQQNPQQQMQPQQFQQQNYPQNYQQYLHQQTNPQFVNNDVNQGQPMVQGIPPQQQGPPYPIQKVFPMTNGVLSIQSQNNDRTGALLVITDKTLRSADGYEFPITIACPTCHVQGLTQIQYEMNYTKHFWALLLCFVIPPLCFIPYLFEDCNNVRHYCTSCSAKVGLFIHKGCC